MNEFKQLKKRIDESKFKGVETAHIRDDYNPIGTVMLSLLTDSGEYVQRKILIHNYTRKWKIFKKEYKPY